MIRSRRDHNNNNNINNDNANHDRSSTGSAGNLIYEETPSNGGPLAPLPSIIERLMLDDAPTLIGRCEAADKASRRMFVVNCLFVCLSACLLPCVCQNKELTLLLNSM